MEITLKDLTDYSIFSSVSDEHKRLLLKSVSNNIKTNRTAGSMVGLTIGDFTGAVLQYIPPTSKYIVNQFKCFESRNMSFSKYNNQLDLKWGQWTDPTAMALCMADSLILQRHFDGSDTIARFWNWWYNGYNSSFKYDRYRSHTLTLRSDIALPFRSIKYKSPPPPICQDRHNSINSIPLTRLAPVPLLYSYNLDDAVYFSKLSSKTTTSNEIVAECCGLLGYIIARTIQRDIDTDIKYFLNIVTDEYLEKYDPCDDIKRFIKSKEKKSSSEVLWNWKEPFVDIELTANNRKDKKKIFFDSNCIDTLAIALNSVYNSHSFNSTIERCVSYLGDCNASASIAGQIAGAFYGYTDISINLIDTLNLFDDKEICLRGVYLHSIAENKYK